MPSKPLNDGDDACKTASYNVATTNSRSVLDSADKGAIHNKYGKAASVTNGANPSLDATIVALAAV